MNSPRRSNQSGIAMIIVMLVIFVLSILAAGFAYSMKVEVKLALNSNNDPEVEWLGRSGIEYAKYVLALQARIPNQNTFEALNQSWAGGTSTNTLTEDLSLENVELGGGKFSVKITDLERKFNINMADEPVIQQALLIMGVDAGSFPIIASSIQDWVDQDDGERINGAESDFYMGLNPPYTAKNGLIDDLSELLLIKGITPELYWGSGATNAQMTRFQSRFERPNAGGEPASYPIGLVDIFTTLSTGRININTASLLNLQMIPEIDENVASSILRMRAGPDGVEGNEDDVPFRNVGELVNVPGLPRQVVQQLARYCDVRSHTFEVQVDVDVRGTKREYFAVVRRSNNTADFQTLKFFWK